MKLGKNHWKCTGSEIFEHSNDSVFFKGGK